MILLHSSLPRVVKIRVSMLWEWMLNVFCLFFGMIFYKYFGEKTIFYASVVRLLIYKKCGFVIEPPVVKRVNIRTLQKIKVGDIVVNTNFLLQSHLESLSLLEKKVPLTAIFPNAQSIECFYKYTRQGVSVDINNETYLRDILYYTRG